MRELLSDALHAWIAVVSTVAGALVGAACSFVVWSLGTRALTDQLHQTEQNLGALADRLEAANATAQRLTHELAKTYAPVAGELQALKRDMEELRRRVA